MASKMACSHDTFKDVKEGFTLEDLNYVRDEVFFAEVRKNGSWYPTETLETMAAVIQHYSRSGLNWNFFFYMTRKFKPR